MDITLKLDCGFEAVFLVNGKLVESGEIVFGEREVVYVTVLPLDALLLPYTTKLVGGQLKSNLPLCRLYRLGDGRYHLRLLPRYNYVYSLPPPEQKRPADLVERLFFLVLDKKLEEARGCLSSELSDSIDDPSLLGFFDGFKDILRGDKSGTYHLIDNENTAVLYRFIIEDGLVDNIVEL